MDMPGVTRPARSRPGVRSPQARTDAHFAATFAAPRTSQASALRSPLLAAKLILPTRQNVRQLAAALAKKLSARMSAAGLAPTPAVNFSVDGAGRIHVSAERADRAAIESMVSSDADLQRFIRATSAIASHAYEIENGGHLQFQRAYRLSSDPQEIVAQYANLLGGAPRAPATAIVFAGGVVSVVTAGRPWVGG